MSNATINAMGQDQRQIIAAEDSEDEFLIEFLPIEKGIHPCMFMVHDITGMATPFMCFGAYMPNKMRAISGKYFGSVGGFATIEQMPDHYFSDQEGAALRAVRHLGLLWVVLSLW